MERSCEPDCRSECVMPSRAPRPCRMPGCPVLTTDPSGWCAEHKRAKQQDQDARRGTARERGYGTRWEKARLGWLRKHPLCVQCLAEGRVTPATVVDHIIPHRGDQALFWDRTNWQALCKAHHDAKTARETFHGEGGSNL